jgi:hypothetical protein
MRDSVAKVKRSNKVARELMLLVVMLDGAAKMFGMQQLCIHLER